MVAEYEGNVNSKLCALLVKAGLNAEKEVSLGRRARADILVRFENHSVAVECEKAGPGKDAGAIKDASSRLSPTPYVAVAFAVVYPQGCSESALTRSTRIRMAKVTRPFANRRARHVQSTIDGASVEAHDVVMPPAFHTCTVDELATMLKNTGKDLGDPKSLVDTLNDTLHSIVSGLTENQMRAIGMSMRLSPDMRGSWRPAARRALLVIAAASMFHRRLDDHLGEMRPDVDARSGKPFKGSWPPMSLSKCQASQSTVPDLSGAWHEILAVDYKAIFTVGRRVLDSSDSLQFTDGVREIIRWARSATGTPGGLRHDVLGRIFHKLLADAKYDGSFYTSIPASILLAGLAIKSRRDLPRHLKDMKVIDPACGTGTLLMASAERMRDVMGGGV